MADKKQLIVHLKYVLKNLSVEGINTVFSRSVREALITLGQWSATQNMIPNTGAMPMGPGENFAHPTMLTWRSRRLAKALGFGLSLGAVSDGDISGTDMRTETTSGVGEFRSRLYLNVPYAKRQEFGGVFAITKKQVAYFWWRARNNPAPSATMWTALAIKGMHGGSVITPPRPFIGPSVESPELHKGILNIVKANLSQAMKNRKTSA